MFVEGKGLVIPKAEQVILSEAEVDWCKEEAAKREKYRQYSQSSASWKHGFRSDAVLLGLIGEVGFSKWCVAHGSMDKSPDVKLRHCGDGGSDFEILGKRIDVKTTDGSRTYDTIWVRRVADDKDIKTLADIYVFSRWLWPVVTLLGFCAGRSMVRFAKSPARGARHWNLEVRLSELVPMSRLVNLLRTEQLVYGTD